MNWCFSSIGKRALLVALVVSLEAGAARAEWGDRLILRFRAAPVTLVGLDLGWSFPWADDGNPALYSQARVRAEVDWRGWGAAAGVGRRYKLIQHVQHTDPQGVNRDGASKKCVQEVKTRSIGMASLEVRFFHPWTSVHYPAAFYLGPEVSTSWGWSYLVGAFCGAFRQWDASQLLVLCGFSGGFN